MKKQADRRKRGPSKSVEERRLDAEVRASRWLADGNEAKDRGDTVRADACYEKAQYWLDRMNLLSNSADKPAPKR